MLDTATPTSGLWQNCALQQVPQHLRGSLPCGEVTTLCDHFLKHASIFTEFSQTRDKKTKFLRASPITLIRIFYFLLFSHRGIPIITHLLDSIFKSAQIKALSSEPLRICPPPIYRLRTLLFLLLCPHHSLNHPQLSHLAVSLPVWGFPGLHNVFPSHISDFIFKTPEHHTLEEAYTGFRKMNQYPTPNRIIM